MTAKSFLPSNSLKHRWVRVSQKPASKKIGKYTMVIDDCYHWVDAENKAAEKTAKRMSRAITVMEKAIQIEKKLFPSVGVSRPSVFAGMYRRAAQAYRDAASQMQRFEIHSIHVAYVKDHPFLEQLNKMPHVPRSVKSLYKASVRLAHLRGTDVFPVLAALNAADAAWAKYTKAMAE